MLAVVPALLWVLAALRRGLVGVDVIAVLSLVGTLLVGEYLAGALIAVMLAGGRALDAAAGNPIDECPRRSATALICTPDSSHATAAEWRNVSTPTPLTFAARDATSMTRSKLRGSTGPPSSVVNTSPESCHWFAARSRSAAWPALCLRSIDTTAGLSGTVRRDRTVFRSVITNRPPTRLIVAATRSTPASRSTRSHDNANAAPLRRPVDVGDRAGVGALIDPHAAA